jgi:hypothetical protein
LKNFTKFALLLSLASAFCFADTWSGKLIDTSCKAKSQASGQNMDCAATKATRTFGIELPDGKVLNLDADGNSKAAEAVKTAKSANMHVAVTGSLDDKGGVKVESLNIQE